MVSTLLSYKKQIEQMTLLPHARTYHCNLMRVNSTSTGTKIRMNPINGKLTVEVHI